MIVEKVLNIIDKRFGPIFVVDKKVISHDKRRGWFIAIDTLKDDEVNDVVSLLKRNKHFDTSTSWIEYMKYSIEIGLRDLNSEHYHQYYERGRELYNKDDDYYYIDIWFDNHMDFDEFLKFKIPKSEITKEELNKFLRR